MADQPTYTRIPNDIIEAMPMLGNAELRVLLAIARKTVGWQKECDVISARQLATMTGLTLKNTQQAVTALLLRGFIAREKAGKQTYCYTLQTVPLGDTVENRTPSDTVTLGDTVPLPVGVRFEAKPLPVGIQQKKDSKEKKEREGSRAARTPTPPKQTNLDSFNEAVSIFKELSGKKQITPALVTLIATRVTDMSAWRTTIESWASCGYNVMNIKDMLDWYDHPEKMATKMGYSNGMGQNQTSGGRMVQRNGHRPANADLPNRPVSSGQAEYERQYKEWLNSDDDSEFVYNAPRL